MLRLQAHCRDLLRSYENRPLALVETAQDAIKKEAITDAEGATQRGLLSPREQDVLALIARGFSYVEIARLQALSMHTVQTHIKNLYGKLAVHSKSEAVFEATRMGLLSRHD